jgi:hypothetical protein
MMRDFVRGHLEPQEPEKPWSKKVVDYLKGMRDFEVQHKTAQAAAEEQQPPVSLVDELRQALEAHNNGNDQPGLNDLRILEAAAGGSLPRSTREAVADVLRQHWDTKNNNEKDTNNG